MNYLHEIFTFKIGRPILNSKMYNNVSCSYLFFNLLKKKNKHKQKQNRINKIKVRKLLNNFQQLD